jgi:hypothetical protein
MYMGVMDTVGTSSFEPFFWTLLAYLVARAVVAGDARAWLWAGVVAGIDLEEGEPVSQLPERARCGERHRQRQAGQHLPAQQCPALTGGDQGRDEGKRVEREGVLELEFYGRDLPPVLAGHNQYALWGLRGTHPDSFIAFNREPDELSGACREARQLTRFYAPWVMLVENDSALTLCRGVHPPFEELWPKFCFYF